MSRKLTVSIKDNITRDLLVHRFRKEANDLFNANAELALCVYNDVYSEKDRKLMASLDDKWLPKSSDISVRFNDDSYVSLDFNGRVFGCLIGIADSVEVVRRPVPYAHNRGCAKVYEAGHALQKRREKLQNRKVDLIERIKDAENQIRASLNSVTTIKRLIESWPEVAPFATKYDKDSAKLPAIPAEKMNEILALPVEEAA